MYLTQSKHKHKVIGNAFFTAFCYTIIILFLLLMPLREVKAKHWDIDGWQWIEKKDKVELWQKEGEDFLSECLLYITVPLRGNILIAYTVKEKQAVLEFTTCQSWNKRLAAWKIVYQGFDISGNIYLMVYSLQDKININEQEKIINAIKGVAKIKGKEADILERRRELFSTFLEGYLKSEGEEMVVNPEKTILINCLNELPAFKISPTKTSSIISVKLTELE